MAIGRRKTGPEDAYPRPPAGREPSGNDIDTDVLVAQQRIAGAEEEHGREQIPLRLEKAVRAVVERLAHDGVGGADQDRDQDQPIQRVADAFVDAVDQSRQREEEWHGDLRTVGVRAGEDQSSGTTPCPPLRVED
jgi:hypothetical protein